MTTHRVSRGRKSQEFLADRWKANGLWHDCEAISASLPGEDVKRTPGIWVEVKATASSSMTEALKQARKGAAGTSELPTVFYRPKGYGEARMGEWQVTMTLNDWEILCRMAGIGKDN